jgi:hypothetical protein
MVKLRSMIVVCRKLVTVTAFELFHPLLGHHILKGVGSSCWREKEQLNSFVLEVSLKPRDNG